MMAAALRRQRHLCRYSTSAALNQLQAPPATVKALMAELKDPLQRSTDPQAAQAQGLPAKRPPEVAAVSKRDHSVLWMFAPPRGGPRLSGYGYRR